jgi:hypothetical protein
MSYPSHAFENGSGIDVIELSVRVGRAGEQEAGILTRESAA